ncbi:MAG: Smr/MutS family protein [Thermoguttaceae bacterium]|nr:Smr/MutS family protein [Thermoguttaceae bacterium]
MGRFEPDASIDLHGLHPDEALRRTRVLMESPENRGKSLMVIHGKGLHGKSYGTLRERVREMARARLWLSAFGTARTFFFREATE